MIYNNKPVEIKYDDKVYDVYKGIITSDGNYLAGYLLDSNVQKYLDVIHMRQIVEVFLKEAVLIIYSFKLNKVIYSKKYTHYDIPILSFIKNNLILNNIDALEIFELNTGKKTYYSSFGLKRYYEAYSNTLYAFDKTKDGFSIKKFDFENKQLEPSLNYKGANGSIQFIHDKRIFAIKDDSINNNIVLYENNNIIKEYSFKNIYNTISSKNNFFVSATNNEEDLILFKFNDTTNNFDIILNYKELWKINHYIFTIEDAIIIKDKIYFIAGSFLPEEENIYEYDLITNKISKVTNNGFVSKPLGIIN